MTEDHLEQLALTWFQDTGWEFRGGPDIAPDGATPERARRAHLFLTSMRFNRTGRPWFFTDRHAGQEAGLIKADETDSASTCYARYLPFWA